VGEAVIWFVVWSRDPFVFGSFYVKVVWLGPLRFDLRHMMMR